MNGIVIFTLSLVPAAPVPGKAPVPGSATVDQAQAAHFARMVDSLAQQVIDGHAKGGLEKKDLIAGAIRGLFDEVGLPVPDSVAGELRGANSPFDLQRVLIGVRTRLGDHANLAGSRSLFAAMNGFRHATDPLSGLASSRVNTYASIDQDFGVGIELEGVTGLRWTIYQVEWGIASGRYAPIGYFGPVPKPEAVPSPATWPWRVKRVVPGSPAQKAGVKPGDQITHLEGAEVTAENANRLFGTFAVARQAFDPQTGRPISLDRTITFRRDDQKPFSPTLKSGAYVPESAFGVFRTAEDRWDCLLDRTAKIGYVRIGPIETGLDLKVEGMLADLAKQGCRGLILDLRWCPGGYVDPGIRIAGMFLKDGSVIAKMDIRKPNVGLSSGDLLAPPGGGKYADLPLVVLVGHETTGGGELIASALRDNNRCVVVGQRTVGRASIQNSLPSGFAEVQFRLTTGTSLRPNGKNRQRKPDSQPTDDWGIRPDDGLEVPITADKSAELRRQAELHALRPANSKEALPFDDPTQDPYRLTALTYLRKKLAAGK